jgi:hypothetical protein
MSEGPFVARLGFMPEHCADYFTCELLLSEI